MCSESRRETPPWSRMSVSDWPARDRELWSAAQAPASLLDSGGCASNWRPATLQLATHAYSLWLGWLRQRGQLSGTADPQAE
jgi:hypothetical protein